MSKEDFTILISSQLEHYRAEGYDEATACELTVRDTLKVVMANDGVIRAASAQN